MAQDPLPWSRIVAEMRRTGSDLSLEKWEVTWPPPTPPFIKGVTLTFPLLPTYRSELPDGSGLHLIDQGSYVDAHIDSVAPSVDLIEHLRRDAPAYFTAAVVCAGFLFIAVVAYNWSDD